MARGSRTGSPTPPMGFNNWNSTHCRAEFNEAMVKGIADLFVEKGLKDAGYQYVNLDDCWALPERDANGKLVPDPARFPDGIKAVADYVHAKGLKLGIYTSAGTKTCNDAGFPGSLGHEQQDAQLFADWGVDYLKYDNCNNQGVDAKQRYTAMRDALNGPPAARSSSASASGARTSRGTGRADVGHLWRTTGDISDNWSTMLSIMKQNLPLARARGPRPLERPGHARGRQRRHDRHRVPHPLLACGRSWPHRCSSAPTCARPRRRPSRSSATTRSSPSTRTRWACRAGWSRREDGRWVVAKEMKDGSRAVALFNETGSAQTVATTAQEAGLPDAEAYTLRDLWQHKSYNTAGRISATVPAHGTVLLRVTADGAWEHQPPATELGLDGDLLVEAGTPAEVTSEVTNAGRTSAQRVSVTLDAPKGWAARATSASTVKSLRTRASLATSWKVTAPADAKPGPYDVTLKATYRSPRGARAERVLPLTAQVAVAPPSGTSSLGDQPWLSATNGWGPVERDTSNGEQEAGDGNPLTIGGTMYEKGLGVHAESAVEYYTGAACEKVTAQVGVDDEKSTKGSVAFEIWADGKKAASTGVLTHAMPAQPLSADVRGARVVRLVATDGGDGVDSDHGDWADATLSC